MPDSRRGRRVPGAHRFGTGANHRAAAEGYHI